MTQRQAERIKHLQPLIATITSIASAIAVISVAYASYVLLSYRVERLEEFLGRWETLEKANQEFREDVMNRLTRLEVRDEQSN